MTARPSIPVPRWATDATYPPGAYSWSGTPTKVTPVSGAIAAGYSPKQKPTAQVLNQRFHAIGEWLDHFAGGEWEDDIELDGDLDITGDLDVAGATTLADTEINNLHVTGQLSHGDRGKLYNAGFCIPLAGSAASLSSPGLMDLSTSTQYVTCPIDVGDAEHIVMWSVKLNKNSASGTITAELVEQSDDGSQVQLGPSLTNNANAPGAITLTSGLVDYPVLDSTKSYFIRVSGGGTVTGGVGDKICSYIVAYTRPPL